MPKFVTIGYGDQSGYDRTAPEVRDAAHSHDDKLRQMGALMGIAGTPVQVRNPEAAGVRTQNAPFMSSSLPLAGFAIIEAASLPRRSSSFQEHLAPLPTGLWKYGRSKKPRIGLWFSVARAGRSRASWEFRHPSMIHQIEAFLDPLQPSFDPVGFSRA